MKKIFKILLVCIFVFTAAFLCNVSSGAIVIRTTDSDGNTTVLEYDSIEEYLNDVEDIDDIPDFLRDILAEKGYVPEKKVTEKAEQPTEKYHSEDETDKAGPEEEPEPDVERTGDVNRDGKITEADARIALRISVGLTLCPDALYYYADADGNGKVEAADARTLLRVSVKLDDKNVLSEYWYWSWGDDYTEVKWLDDVELYEGGKYTVPYDILVSSGEKLKWTSTVPSVATVDANGKIKAVSKGYTCVYASAGNARYCINVTVLNSLQKKIYALQEKYPAGYYWNKNEKSKKYPAVSEIPCPGHPNDYSTCLGQCAGFASLLSNEVFGSKAPYYYGVTADKIKIGDSIRIKPSHTVFVTDIIKKGSVMGYNPYDDENIKAESDMFVVADCNWHWCCDIGWGRQMYISESDIISAQSYSRYK